LTVAKHKCPVSVVIAEDEFDRLNVLDASTTKSATKPKAKE
jgi:hypothetical protein